MIVCDRERRLVLIAMFPAIDPEELRMFGARSLMVNGEPRLIEQPTSAENKGAWSMVRTFLTPRQVAALKEAEQVGVAVQLAIGAPMFYGFGDMTTNGMPRS